MQSNPHEAAEPCDCVRDHIAADSRKNLPDDEMLYEIADFYKVFGDSTRVKILYALLHHELCVGGLTEALDMTQSAVSHQLKVLRENNLVKFRREGKTVYYSLDDDHVSVVLEQALIHLTHRKIEERK